jgi:hypothetical protein
MKKINIRKLLWRFFIVLAVILPVSCKTIPPGEPEFSPPVHNIRLEAETYSEVFAALWEIIDKTYVFWDMEEKGYWDQVWDTYKPKFDALPDTIDSLEQALTYWEEVLAPLHDGHFIMQLRGDRANWEYGPGKDRVGSRFKGPLDDANPVRVFSWESDWAEPESGPVPYHWNFMDRLIAPKYLDEHKWVSYPSLRIALGKIAVSGSPDEHISYLYFNTFAIQENLYKENTYIPAIPEDRRFVTILLNQFREDVKDPRCRGVIFDLRGNSGGAIDDIDMLLTPMVEEDQVVLHHYYKAGEGRLDYNTGWKMDFLADFPPEEQIVNMDMPIVVLVNDYSISCGELMPMIIKEIANGYIIGTRTFGATGLIVHSRLSVGWGEFQEWTIIQADVQTKDMNFKSLEVVGVEPDEVVPFSWKQFTNNEAFDAGGTDTQLEAGIRYIDPARVFP